MADSVSTEAWLDQRRWAALEEALKAQGSNVKRHLQDYLITLYNETVPLERWVQIETAITKEELESAQAAEDQKVYAAFHIRENGHDSIFSTGNGEEFLDVAILSPTEWTELGGNKDRPAAGAGGRRAGDSAVGNAAR